jgi:hypothetical protein
MNICEVSKVDLTSLIAKTGSSAGVTTTDCPPRPESNIATAPAVVPKEADPDKKLPYRCPTSSFTVSSEVSASTLVKSERSGEAKFVDARRIFPKILFRLFSRFR